jgi:hypothetical protein
LTSLDTLVIPTQDAIIALDLAASSIMRGEDEGVALSDTSDYIRLSNVFQFHRITGPFSRMVLNAAKKEGKRQAMKRQPIHVRMMNTLPQDSSLLTD